MLVHFLPKIFVNFPLIAYLKDLSILFKFISMKDNGFLS